MRADNISHKVAETQSGSRRNELKPDEAAIRAKRLPIGDADYSPPLRPSSVGANPRRMTDSVTVRGVMNCSK